MPAYNKVIIMGNLVAKPELRFTPNGSPVAEMRVAINEKGNDGAAKTVFVPVEAWGKTAENCDQFLDKGACVHIDGRIDVDEWNDRETGKKRSKMKVTAYKVTFLDSRKADESKSEPRTERVAEKDPDFDTDVPF